MPLKMGKGQSIVRSNIKTEIKSGKPQPAAQVSSGWSQFEHWAYCPDAPGKCKCLDKK